MHICGGSIISEYYVVTAAHCLSDYDVGIVRAGSSIWKSGGSIHQLEKFIKHEDFDLNEAMPYAHNDIAVIRVNPPFKFDKTRHPIELFGEDEIAKANAAAVATGWGRYRLEFYQSYIIPDRLQKVIIPFVSRKACDEIYEKWVSGGLPKGQICAGGVGSTRGPCHGDSGGPLTIDGKLAGVVSWAFKGQCADPVYPTVFTEIAFYRDWIRNNTNF